MRKEIEFLTKFDTSEFDRSVEMMQRKLREIYRPADMVGAQRQTAQRLEGIGIGGMSKPTLEAFQKSIVQTRRDLDKIISDEVKNQEKLAKTIAKRAEDLKGLERQQKSMVKGSEDELKLREKISQIEENQYRMREQYRAKDQSINSALDAREQLKTSSVERMQLAYRMARQGMYGAAGRQAGAALGGIGGPGLLGLAGSALGGAGAFMQGGAELYRDFSRTPLRTDQSMGSAVQGTLGRPVSDIYARRTAFENVWAPERARAAQMSLEAMQAQRTSDKWSLGGAALKTLGMGAAGAGAGALAGSFIPGVGTMIGGAVGGIGGLGKGIYDTMTDDRQRSLALGGVSESQRKRYQSILAEQLSKDYETAYEAQKQQNPFKKAAAEEYEQNFMRNLEVQRTMGLTNQQFYGQGGYQSQAITAGFTPDQAMQMSQGIMGAGGSTRMARDSAFGLQMQRGMDLTNASQVLGTLSSGLGSSESTKQATVKILAEGMKLGLDDSKFAEENRKFTQAVADIIVKSGASSGSDEERVSGGFGRFLGESTNKGIEAAQTAYQQYQQISQTTTGARGVMRAAGFMSDPNLSKISTMTKQALMKVPEADLNENNPLVQAAADEASKALGRPVSAKDIVNSITGVNQGAVSRFAESDQIRDRLRSKMKERGMTRMSEADLKDLPEDMQRDFRQLTTFQTTELGYQGQRETIARALGTINTGGGTPEEQKQRDADQKAREGTITGKIEGVGGRMEDTTMKAMAADSKVVLENFNEMAPAMRKAAESSAAFSREMKELNASLQQALEDARKNKSAEALANVQKIVEQLARQSQSQNQTQGGKPSQ